MLLNSMQLYKKNTQNSHGHYAPIDGVHNELLSVTFF